MATPIRARSRLSPRRASGNRYSVPNEIAPPRGSRSTDRDVGKNLNDDPGRRKSVAEFAYFGAYSRDRRVVVNVCDHLVHPDGNAAHLRFLHAARGYRGRPQADTAGAERFARIVRHRIVVADDSRTIQRLRRLLADDILVRKVNQD